MGSSPSARARGVRGSCTRSFGALVRARHTGAFGGPFIAGESDHGRPVVLRRTTNRMLRRRPLAGDRREDQRRAARADSDPSETARSSLGLEPSGGGHGQRNRPSLEGVLGVGSSRARERVVSARKLSRGGALISDTSQRFLRRVSTWKLPFQERRRGSRDFVSFGGRRVFGALSCQGRRGERKLRGIRNRRSRRTRGAPAAAVPCERRARRCRGGPGGRANQLGGQRSMRRRGERRLRGDRQRRRVVGQGFAGRASCAAAEARNTRRPWTWLQLSGPVWPCRSPPVEIRCSPSFRTSRHSRAGRP